MTTLTKQEWDAFLQHHPEAHFLQCGAWGEVKSHFGWYPRRIQVGDVGAQVLFRKLPLKQTIAYVPKGPVGKPDQNFWSELNELCHAQSAIFLKIEPDYWEGDNTLKQDTWVAFQESDNIQPRRTIIVDLSAGEDAVLSRMKQKTRYNINLAVKKGIVVKPWRDFESLGKMFAITADRDGFGVHTALYYQKVFEEYHKSGQVEVLCGFLDTTPLAVIMVIKQGDRSWYVYGASTNLERNRMPTYLLQWEGIRWAIAQGCKTYDLWGIPDEEESDLEAGFEGRSDGLWGVYRFKRGFGGEVFRSATAHDRVYSPIPYKLYQWYIGRRKQKTLGG